MSGIETIKQELIQQKELILEKGGVITVANDYPSPSEVTAGIKTLTTPDFTQATATEEDVVLGKTFFSGNSEMKTGKGLFQADMMYHIFAVEHSTKSTEETVYYTCPSGLRCIKEYCFYYNFNPICVTFNPELTEIDDNAFYNTPNISFEGFSELKNLKRIGRYAFGNCNLGNLNFAALPNCVTELANYAFYNSFNENYADFVLPSGITSMAASVYRQDKKRNARSLDLSNFSLTTLPDYTFEYIFFDCDCNFPEGFTTIKSGCFYNGCFHNISFPSTLTKLESSCFSASSSKSPSEFYLKTVTFTSETPPTISSNVFATQHVQNGLKIYVPDTAIEEYKAVANLSQCLDCICPMSEKE